MKRSILLLPWLVVPVGARIVLGADSKEETLTLQNSNQQQTSQNTEALRDIHGPLPTSEYPPYLIEAVIALLVILLLALLFFLMKRRKKPLPPPVPPWETALRELEEARQLIRDGQSLLYMELAGQILRRYIELRFAIRSTRQTTREFFAGLKGSGGTPLVDYQTELRACLEQADMAKFAHLIPDNQHLEQMEAAVRTFITRTRPETLPPGGRS
jgi:Domain of unknown function (DUF4381)